MRRYYWVAGLFNIFMGSMLFFVLAARLMSFLYVADALDWIPDPTLDAGLLPAFLIIAVTLSAIYLPAMIITNTGLRRRLQIRKSLHAYLAAGLHVRGLVGFHLLIRVV